MKILYLVTVLSFSLLLSNCTIIGITISHFTNSSYYEEVLLTQESLKSLAKNTYVKIYLKNDKVHKGQFFDLDTFNIDNDSKLYTSHDNQSQKHFHEHWQITIRDNKKYFKYLESEIRRIDKFNKDDNALTPVLVGATLDVAVIIFLATADLKQ